MNKKFLAITASAVACVCMAGTLAACGEQRTVYTYREGVNYSDQIDESADGTYDKGLFYVNAPNAKTPTMPDPAVLYVQDETSELNGQYLLFGTNNTKSFICYKSSDLVNWQYCSVAFQPNESSWGTRTLWAPEAIYDAEKGLYYLFYSAGNAAIKDAGLASDTFDACMLNVAVSENPEGPYLEYGEYKLRQEKEAKGETPTPAEIKEAVAEPWLDQEKMLEAVPDEAKGGANYFIAIDPSPFVAPDGTKYLYFTRDRSGATQHTWVWVMQMTDWATPAIGEDGKIILKQLTFEDTGSYEQASNSINEGPQMTYYNGKYILQFSVNSYTTSAYCVGLAVSDNPMGPFRKLTTEEGGLFIYSGDVDGVSGSGHHFLFQVNGEWFALYHRHRDPISAGANRVPAIDAVSWVEVEQADGSKLTIPHLNGPSTTLQLAPTSEYRNIAPQAKLNVSKGNNAEALTDGLIPMHGDLQPWIKEYEMNQKSATITLTFDDYRTVAALMFFNSKNYETCFEKIDSIRMDCMINGEKAYADIFDLKFSEEYYEGQRMKAGAAAIAAFADLQVKSITITLNRLYSDQEVIALSEIYVIGK